MKKVLFYSLALMLFFAGGCTHWISDQSRAMADRSISFSQLAENPSAYRGKLVMLGGAIEAINKTGEGTQLEITEHRLDSHELPEETTHSGGRFVAITPQTLDPDTFAPGELVSIVGEVTGTKTLSQQGVQHVYPLIVIKEIRNIVIQQETEWGYFGGV